MAVFTVNPNQNISVRGTTTFVGYANIETQLSIISAQANAASYEANVAYIYANSVYDVANSAAIEANLAYSLASSVSGTANTALNTANTALYDGIASYNQANLAFAQANSAYNAANNAGTYAQPAFIQANAAFLQANAAYNAANNAGTYAQPAFIQANSAFVQANLAFTEANSAAQYANAAFVQANAAFLAANTPIYEANSAAQYANAAFIQANAAFAFANTISGGSAIDNVARTTANAAFTQANAAFNAANSIVVIGNTINLGTNTAGLLVSNAVTLTVSTSVTNAVAEINQILGKLVPNSPPAFPSTYGTITINSLVGPYRVTNFTQQDNTGTGTASVAGGTSVNILRTSSYTTSSILLINSQVGDVLTVTKNAAPSGTRTITAAANGAQYNTGTYGDLHIISNADYASIGAISYANFWYFANVNATGTVANGWNNVSITDTDGSPTSNATWYYDNNSPGTPTFSSLSIVPNSVSLTYSSTVPHYNSSTTFLIGANVSKLSGDTFPASNTFMTGSAGGAFGTPASNTYAAVGITYPLARNLYVSSGSVTVNTSASIISGFSSSSTGPSITIDNSYATGTQSFTTTLANTILYKTGTSSSMEETGFIASGFGTAVGSGNAVRIVNYDGGTANDTPAFTAGQTAFNSQTGTFYTTDATVVAAVLKNDTTNYSTGYLPPGPNLSSQGSVQYITLRMTRTSVSKFSINYTTSTGIGGIWCAMPGQTSYGPLNNWYSMTVDNSIAGGCALGGNLVPSSTGSKTYNCQFAGLNSSNATNNEILVRIRLNAGQSITALSFAASTV